MTVFAMGRAPSPLAGSGLGAADRLDPYWDGLWTQGSTATWSTRDDVAAQCRAGLVRPPAWMTRDAKEALGAFTIPYMREHRLGMLAAVNSWRTLSAQQLAALTGYAGFTSAGNRFIADGFCAGLLDVGAFISPAAAGARARGARLVRTARTNVFDQSLAAHLTYPEWVHVTGGVGWRTAGQFDRHNVLTAELGLRVAELCEVGTVLGESHSQVELLTASAVCPPTPDLLGKAADATVVRTDGMRIAVELTASISSDFATKVMRWAQVLAQSPFDMTGLMVVFVVVPPPSRAYHWNGNSLMTQVRSAIDIATKQFPGTGRDRVADRIGVASWEEWFPGRHQVDSAFFELAAWRPTGPNQARWERAGLLQPLDVPFAAHPDHDPLSVVEVSAWLGGVAHWLRPVHPARHMWPLLLDGRVPVPAGSPTRPASVSSFAIGRGVAGDALPPRRMQVLPGGAPCPPHDRKD